MRDESGQALWAEELATLARAASGGLLFGIPLLFTMEVWWTGTRTSPEWMLGVVALTFVPLFLLNRTAGFRTRRDVDIRDAMLDTVKAVGLGLVLVTVVLILLGEVSQDTPVAAALGKVTYELLPFCLGIGVARHYLGRGRDAGDDDDDDQHDDALNATIADVGATTIGAVFIALNIAPTDEVLMLAARLTPLWQLAVVAASLLTSYAIVFVAGFHHQERRHAQVGIFQRPFVETVVCYLVALAVAAVMLWLFQRGAPGPFFLAQVIVLGWPASVGGAAGRLAI
jgi:putative integral membrane protein (TIGR02587 family)